VTGASYDIDARVKAILQEGLSVYRVDAQKLETLKPDIIVTQDHCEVCAVSLKDVEAALSAWGGRRVEIVSLKPDALATSGRTSLKSPACSGANAKANIWWNS